jgi:uncharacterized protein
MTQQFLPSSGTAAITGAASGIGAAFARALAAKGLDLLLIDKSADGLAFAAEELRKAHSVRVETLVANLADPAGIRNAADRVASVGDLAILVNGAGFGLTGRFYEADIDRQVDMIHVHVVASVRLTHAALPAMLARNSGAIINIASLSAMTRMPQVATYTPTKMYLVAFSECLAVELANTNIKVQALCPGLVDTNFIHTEEMAKVDRSGVPKVLWMNADNLVALSLKALQRGRITYIPGLWNRLQVLAFGSKPGQTALRCYRRLRDNLVRRKTCSQENDK